MDSKHCLTENCGTGNSLWKNQEIGHSIFYQTNDIHSPLFRQSSNPCIQLNKKDQEAFVRLLADLNITSDQIITLPNLVYALHNNICEIHLTSFGFQDEAQPTSMIKALFEETISEEFQDYFIIATDASKSHLYTSIVGTSNLRLFCFRFHPINSPDSTYVCSKFDFYLILSCHGKFDASML
ncbi:hypothetical protein AVEN_89446-1 [Araneus ventricosus]|uniref:Uncharacterized protein n=1 Tax=Araneus ventricosus TaxID=182803 RepID=A0A4Y2HN82_ARAVE|nr:hypothetical protein AVEN_89446-1 [Araneus ventricosus]